MNINYKKSLRLLTLFIASLLIATVSASTYYSMFMSADDIGVATGNKVFFTPGADWDPASAMGSGNQTVTLANLDGMNGTATIISDPVRIYNNDTGSQSLNLKLDSWTGDSQNQLNYINVTVYNATSGGTAQGNTIYLVLGSGDVTETGTLSIGSGETWRVEWVIYWKTTATTETVDVNLKLEVS
jgi:hypothetical protein